MARFFLVWLAVVSVLAVIPCAVSAQQETPETVAAPKSGQVYVKLIMPTAPVDGDQDPTPESIARRQFNQVFVKVIMPVTAHTPKQDGPVIEAWVAAELKQLGESEYFAVTNWVPVCDGLLADDIVDNDVWDGRLGKASFCDVDGDLPERKDGRVVVSVIGWSPGRAEARVTLADEPGTRAVEPALSFSPSGENRQAQGENPMAYVAVLIGPPPEQPAAPTGSAASSRDRPTKAVTPSDGSGGS